jgi:hypothetical protein
MNEDIYQGILSRAKAQGYDLAQLNHPRLEGEGLHYVDCKSTFNLLRASLASSSFKAHVAHATFRGPLLRLQGEGFPPSPMGTLKIEL